jgi:hypothetical protein
VLFWKRTILILKVTLNCVFNNHISKSLCLNHTYWNDKLEQIHIYKYCRDCHKHPVQVFDNLNKPLISFDIYIYHWHEWFIKIVNNFIVKIVIIIWYKIVNNFVVKIVIIIWYKIVNNCIVKIVVIIRPKFLIILINHSFLLVYIPLIFPGNGYIYHSFLSAMVIYIRRNKWFI